MIFFNDTLKNNQIATEKVSDDRRSCARGAHDRRTRNVFFGGQDGWWWVLPATGDLAIHR